MACGRCRNPELDVETRSAERPGRCGVTGQITSRAVQRQGPLLISQYNAAMAANGQSGVRGSHRPLESEPRSRSLRVHWHTGKSGRRSPIEPAFQVCLRTGKQENKLKVGAHVRGQVVVGVVEVQAVIDCASGGRAKPSQSRADISSAVGPIASWIDRQWIWLASARVCPWIWFEGRRDLQYLEVVGRPSCHQWPTTWRSPG